MTCHSRIAYMLTALGALGACGTDTLPPTNTPGPSASVVTTQPVVTTVPGTIVTPPGTVAVVNPSPTLAVVPAPRLSSAEILALLTGNTVSGTASDGQPYYARFMRNGSVNLREGSNYTANGSWHVTADGQLCSSLSNVNSGIEQCYTLYRGGSGYVYERPDGHPVGSFTVTPGA